MSRLEKLKAATTLHDVASLVGYKPRTLSYILYKKKPEEKYREFEIPKRSGGVRVISAPNPDLMNLQRNLSELLQDCIAEINSQRKISNTLSHGFRRKHSIMTNSAIHQGRRNVLNIDLENFFGSINFGRVRGFLITNQNFRLDPKVATILAQISCHDNKLPQGSPCSPVISNLIGHLLDVRLAQLAYETGCTFSRYADDITFSTNKRFFDKKLVTEVPGDEHKWVAGPALTKVVEKAGFKINSEKTRVQYTTSRQEVTGLVVNAKVNTRAEYRHMARAMVHRLVTTGGFQRKHATPNEAGKPVWTEKAGTLDELNGILSFIDSVEIFDRKRGLKPSDRDKALSMSADPSCQEKDYQRFLFYKHFFAPTKPLIICEGKTDNIYLQCAIRRLSPNYPLLLGNNSKGSPVFNVTFFRRTPTTDRLLGLTGGTDQLVNLMRKYIVESKHAKTLSEPKPIIIFIDNDEGAKPVIGFLKRNVTKADVDRNADFFKVHKNLYVIFTPLTAGGKDTMVEDFFPDAVRETKLNGKSFNPKNEGIDHKTEYGKAYFASHVINKNQDTIDFTSFKPILERIEAVLKDYSKTSVPDKEPDVAAKTELVDVKTLDGVLT